MIGVGPSSIMNQCEPDFMPEWNKSHNTLTFPNGCVAIGISGDSPESARGLSSSTVWLDELAKYSDPEETFAQLDLGLRGTNAQCLTTTTPLPRKIIKDLYTRAKENDPLYRIVTGSTYENKANLDDNYIKSIQNLYANTSREKQEIFGEIIWSSDLAMFKVEDIDKYRVEHHPDFKRIIVAVDPAVTSKTNSDNTGIIVAALGVDDEVYILKDKTMKGTPAQWSTMVGELYDFYQADAIVAEKNQGGDMVTTTIQTYRNTLPVKLVTATRGKLVRSEPVSLAFEQGKIHLVGDFPDLEQQMVEFDGTQRYSPDNLDAFVWAVSDLMLGKTNKITSSEFLL